MHKTSQISTSFSPPVSISTARGSDCDLVLSNFDPRSPPGEEVLYILHDIEDGLIEALEGAVDNVRAIVNALVLDKLLQFVANPQHKILGELNAVLDEAAYMPRDIDDDLKVVLKIAGAVEKVIMIVDGVALDANLQHKTRAGGNDRRERDRRGHHERNDYLKPPCLFDVCAAEDRAYHHAREYNDAHKAVEGK